MRSCWLGLALLATVGCEQVRGRAQRPAAELHDCRLEALDARAECGRIEVWEDRDARAGRKLSIAFARLPARGSRPAADPLLVFVGGPGQSAMRSGVAVAQALWRIGETRDIVLIDQRGTGKSGALNCRPQSTELSQLFDVEFRPDETKSCLEQLDAAPELYTTPIAVADIDDVRAYLGYERVNLWGASYGTRVALIYARQFPDHTRRLVLDGVAPLDVKLPLYSGRDAERALDLVSRACSNEPACRARYGNPRATLETLLQSLDANPASVTVRDPRSGEPVAISVTRDAFAAALRMQLYTPLLDALLPLFIDRAAAGDFEPFVSGAAAIGLQLDADMASGMFLSVACAEDVVRISSEEARVQSLGHFLGRDFLIPIQQACQVWPQGRLPVDYFAPFELEARMLILSGERDPILPPSWGELVHQHHHNSRHVVVPGAGHGITLLPCAARVIENFLDAEHPLEVDATCLERHRAPPFFTSPLGPEP